MPATPAWPPRSAPRLFIPQHLFVGAQIELKGNQAHYLGKVMRVTIDDVIILCDDQTGEWAANVASIAKRSIWLTVTQQIRPRETVPDFWLCAALLKKDRFDIVLEKATELGVAQIRPILTRRCVANKLNSARAQAIITEAAEQCARTALPKLGPPVSLKQLLKTWPDGRALFFADENGGHDASSCFTRTSAPAALLIGPEGGFDDDERETIRALPQASPISLGPRILRGETAAIAATALWMGLQGDWTS